MSKQRLTLGSASLHLRERVWGLYEAGSWWWCKSCECVTTAADIPFDSEGDLCCPHCLAWKYDLFWYHGWPARVLVGWEASPVSGKRYPLPEDWDGRESLVVH